MEIISHYRDKETAPQSNDEHQHGVADMAGRFAAQFGMGSYGSVLGLLHDKGKEQADFQTYIRKVSGMCPELIVKNHPNHAYVGALIAKKYYQGCYLFWLILSWAIIRVSMTIQTMSLSYGCLYLPTLMPHPVE